MKLDLLGLITHNFAAMRDFYRDVLVFEILLEMEHYVEFKNEGIRFAISTSEVMHKATGEESYLKPTSGHALELAFKVDGTKALDEAYNAVIDKGAKAIKAPADMPWGQRTSFFADPDGNIHEIFTDL
jgi:lactoylglutathione lyase